MELSIVIPAYNEAGKIAGDIITAAEFLLRQNIAGEILVVDDGSRDGTAEAARSAKIPAGVPLHVERVEQNRGKGHAIRRGVERSGGKYVMFADSGNCIPYVDVLDGLELIRSGQCEIAHGSRKMPQSEIRHSQNPYRRICSKVFHALMHAWMGISSEFTDTQCGFKVYRGDVAREIYGQCITDGFMIDIEVLLRAMKKGYRVREFPVQWSCDPDSRLHPLRSAWRNYSDLRRIRQSVRGE